MYENLVKELRKADEDVTEIFGRFIVPVGDFKKGEGSIFKRAADAIDNLEDIMSEKMIPTTRAKWIFISEDDDFLHTIGYRICSQCHYRPVDQTLSITAKYCPSCGSRMMD